MKNIVTAKKSRHVFEIMFLKFLTFLLWLCLTGCSLMPASPNEANTQVMPLAHPIGPARRIVQQLTAVWADRQESLIAVLELDAQHIAMAGLSNEGLSLFNLTYDGKTITTDQNPLLPATVKPEFFITDLQLVYWPIAELQKTLPSQWRLEATDTLRSLYFKEAKQVEIRYLTPDAIWPKEVELVNLHYHYHLKIKTLSYELVSE